ncbi:MAG TPA: alpha-amylase family glycosyl hydrolase [Acidimicrobiales bacterium]|nr:alpha-amylase family glycosyl hydrolase [Acidimicrobiales bacterium]
MPEAPWWKTAVVYQIYPRSFADGGRGGPAGAGVGDLEGIRRHLDHLSWLGVDAVWLSPFYRSPMADFGYDVSDHCDVDPVFGSLADFDRLLAEAHQRGLRVLIDWVPNHTSDRHPWFLAARSSRHDPNRSWYIWRDPAPDGGPPNNWRAAFGDDVAAWTLHPGTGQYYLHLFLPEQPDLNWSHRPVVEAMHDMLRFWLDRGVDGFRADVVHGIGKDPALADDPVELVGQPRSSTNDDPATHDLLREIRALLDTYPGQRVMVGEVYLLDTAKVAPYYGADDELHLAFNFPPLFAPWDGEAWRSEIEAVQRHLLDAGAWPTWVLGNHDTARPTTRYGSEARARAAGVLLLALPGTPFLYAGDELGLEDAIIPPEAVVDPGGRDGCRAPLPWDSSPGHGWGASPWLPWPPEADSRNVALQRDDPGSILHLYRRLLEARRASPALSLGRIDLLDAPTGVLAWTRRSGEDRRMAAVNFTTTAVTVPHAGHWKLEVASDGAGEGTAWDGTLAPDQAVILRPD